MIQIDTRTRIHIGVNFVMSHMPLIDSRFKLSLQKHLDEAKIVYSDINHNMRDSVLNIARTEDPPIQITVSAQGQAALGPGLGQLLIISSGPSISLEQFCDESDRIVRAFEEVVPAPQRQILSKDTAIRELYDA